MRINILGVEIDNLSSSSALHQLKKCLQKQQRCFVVTPNPEIILHAISNEHYQALLNGSQLSLPDGFGLKIAACILGYKLKHRITGIDTMYQLCKYAAQKHHSIYLLGAKKGVCQQVKKNLEQQFPGIQIVGYHEGGVITQDGIGTKDTQVITDIQEKKPHILFVAFGAPKQEFWIKRHEKELSHVHVLMGIGGSFDVLAHRLKRAPFWMRRMGMEWMYRLWQEPKRLFRIFNAVIKFPLIVFWWKIRAYSMYRPNVAGLITNNNKDVLIVRRKGWDNHWQIPQGGIELFEKIQEGAKREMFEETGLQNLQVIAMKKRFHKYLWEPWHRLNRGYKGQKQHLVIFQYLGKNEDVVIDEFEIDAYKWVPLSHLVQNVHPIRRDMTKKAFFWYEKLVKS